MASALLEESVDTILLWELLVVETQDIDLLSEEMDMLKKRVMGRIPSLLEERRKFSGWWPALCHHQAEGVASKKLAKFLRGLDRNMTLGELCLLTEGELFHFKKAGRVVAGECATWITENLPKVSVVVMKAYHARDVRTLHTEIRPDSMLGIAMPDLLKLRC